MSCMTTSAPPERSITWMGSILNLARRIRESRKIPTALIFVLERMASRWREEMSFPQNAVTRMLTPAAAIMAITAGRRDFKMP